MGLSGVNQQSLIEHLIHTMDEASQRLEACIARSCEQQEMLMNTFRDDQLRFQDEVRSSLSSIRVHDSPHVFGVPSSGLAGKGSSNGIEERDRGLLNGSGVGSGRGGSKMGMPTVAPRDELIEERFTDLGEAVNEMVNKAFERALEVMHHSLAEWAMKSQTTATKQMGLTGRLEGRISQSMDREGAIINPKRNDHLNFQAEVKSTLTGFQSIPFPTPENLEGSENHPGSDFASQNAVINVVLGMGDVRKGLVRRSLARDGFGTGGSGGGPGCGAELSSLHKPSKIIQQLWSRLEWWNSEPKLTRVHYNFLGLLPGQDNLYANALLFRLDEFSTCDKHIKLCIAKVFMFEYKQRKKRRMVHDRILSKLGLCNYLELLRRLKLVFETRVVEVRSLCLSLFGCWASLAHDNAEIRCLILSSLVSSDVLEVKASLFAAVYRIGILEIRILNTDRHAGNLLVRKLGGVGGFGQVELISIVRDVLNHTTSMFGRIIRSHSSEDNFNRKAKQKNKMDDIGRIFPGPGWVTGYNYDDDWRERSKSGRNGHLQEQKRKKLEKMPEVRIIAKNFMDMVASLLATILDNLYHNAFICEAILRSLPSLAKKYVLQILYIVEPIAATLMEAWVPAEGKSKHRVAIDKLVQLRLFTETVDRKRETATYRLNPAFQKNLHNHILHGGVLPRVPMQISVRLPSSVDLYTYASEQWESFLLHLISSTEAPRKLKQQKTSAPL